MLQDSAKSVLLNPACLIRLADLSVDALNGPTSESLCHGLQAFSFVVGVDHLGVSLRLGLTTSSHSHARSITHKGLIEGLIVKMLVSCLLDTRLEDRDEVIRLDVLSILEVFVAD